MQRRGIEKFHFVCKVGSLLFLFFPLKWKETFPMLLLFFGVKANSEVIKISPGKFGLECQTSLFLEVISAFEKDDLK